MAEQWSCSLLVQTLIWHFTIIPKVLTSWVEPRALSVYGCINMSSYSTLSTQLLQYAIRIVSSCRHCYSQHRTRVCAGKLGRPGHHLSILLQSLHPPLYIVHSSNQWICIEMTTRGINIIFHRLHTLISIICAMHVWTMHGVSSLNWWTDRSKLVRCHLVFKKKLFWKFYEDF